MIRQTKKYLFLIVVVLLVFGMAKANGFAAEGLFKDLQEIQTYPFQLDREKPEPTVVRSRKVGINFDLIMGDQSPEGAESILLNLFEDASFQATKERLEQRSPTSYTWFGRIAGATLSQVVMVVEDGIMAGNITAEGESYQIRSIGDDLHLIRKIDQSYFSEEAPPIPVSISLDQSGSSSPSPQADSGSVIDVLVVYTPAVANAFSNKLANIMANIQLAIDETNQSYANSGVTQRVRLVHAAQVNYTETGNASTDLSRLQNPSDGYMDEVHSMRNTYGADLVSLWVENLGGYCGIGYLMTNASQSFAPYAFSAVARSCATGYYSFGHEMGHNMGAHHDRYVNDGSGAYSYSHGYVYTQGKWRTVMAYNDQCSAQGFSCTRIPYWSNPNINYLGVPTGISQSVFDSANNALSLNNTAYTVANFRSSVPPNLTPYQPSGWSDKIVISKLKGTTTDSSPLYTTDTLYVNWAVVNNGSGSTSSTFYTQLYVDGVPVQSWSTPAPMNPNDWVYILDYSIGSLSAGNHTIRLVTDSTGAIAESSETDNEYTKTISVLRRRPAVDFDGDSKTDPAFYRASTGVWFIRPSAGSFYGTYFPAQASDILVPGDYDGDGKTDLAFYRASTGVWFIFPSGGSFYGAYFGGDPSDIPVPGDYDGDGKTDLAFYRASTGVWFIQPSNGGNFYEAYFGGGPSDIPVPGDYDGDGKTDLAFYRPTTGVWFILPSRGGSAYGVYFGLDPSDVLVPGDYDGDGKTDFAFYRPTTGVWFILPSGGGSFYGVYFGLGPSDILAPGDYDGDGKTDLAFYRPSNGVWFILPSGGGGFYGVYFGGGPSDIPVTMPLP